MLLLIHNLPIDTRYSDVKSLIESKCGLYGVILDGLVIEGNRRKVTVGVAEEEDAAMIVRKINGLYMNGMQLYVENVRQKKASEQPYRSNVRLLQEAQTEFQKPVAQSHRSQETVPLMVPPPINYYDRGMPDKCYMPTPQTSYMNEGQINPVMSQYSVPEYSVNSESTSGLGKERIFNNGKSLLPTPQPHWEQSSSSKRSYSDLQHTGPSAKQFDRGLISGRHDNTPNWNMDNNNYDKRMRMASPPRDPWSSNRRSAPWLGQHDQETPSDRESQNLVNRFKNQFESNSNRGFCEAHGSKTNVFGTHVTGSNFSAITEPRPSRCDGPMPRRHNQQDFSYLGKANTPIRGDSAQAFKSHPFNNLKQSNYCPPAKRFKNDNDGSKAGFSNSNPVPRNIYVNIKKILHTDLSWRGHATGVIAKEIISKTNSTKVSIPDHMILDRVKRTVRSRLQILADYNLQLEVDDLIFLYREKFTPDDDQKLIDFILKQLEREIEQPEKKTDKSAKKKPKQQKTAVQQPAAEPVVMTAPVGKLPKYPQGNKKLAQQLKKNNLMAFIEGSKSLESNPLMQAALKEELDIIQKLMEDECSGPQGVGEQLFCEQFKKPTVLGELLMVIKVNLSKRISGVDANPVIRIHGYPKPPKKAELEQFLLGRGVLSLKKSAKNPYFIACCDSYKSFDELCALQSVMIGNIQTVFKPMYLTGLTKKHINKLEKKGIATNRVHLACSKVTENRNSCNIDGSNDIDNGQSIINDKPQTDKEETYLHGTKDGNVTEILTVKDEKDDNEQELKQNLNESQKNQITLSSDKTEVQSGTTKSILDHNTLEVNSISQKQNEVQEPAIDEQGDIINVRQETNDQEKEFYDNNENGSGAHNSKTIKIEKEIEIKNVPTTEHAEPEREQNRKEIAKNSIEIKNVPATEHAEPEQELNGKESFDGFVVVDEIIGDDSDSDEETTNVKYEDDIEIPNIDQVNEDDLEDY